MGEATDRLFWAGRGGREGWWVDAVGGGNLGAVRGPPICSSSGGGPREALATARRLFPDLACVRVEPPPRHTIWPTSATCELCAREAAAVTEEARA